MQSALTLKEINLRRENRKRHLQSCLESLQRQLAEMGALRLILFGSFSQGRTNSRSDLDLLVVMPPDLTGREWMKRIYSEVDRDVDCDILAYTNEELENLLPVSRFLRHAMKTGRVIYEKESRD